MGEAHFRCALFTTDRNGPRSFVRSRAGSHIPARGVPPPDRYHGPALEPPCTSAMWLAPRTSLAYIILAKKLWTLTNSSLLSIQRRLFTFSSSFKSSSVLPSFYMNFVQRCAAVVSFVRPGGHITEPAIYNIEIPTKDERSLSHDAVTATIIGNIWTVVGGSIVVAQVERVPYDPDEPPILRPLESVSAATARSSPILLNKAILDPNHFDYETFDKCYSSEENLNSVWAVGA